jgi:hypothetical protein
MKPLIIDKLAPAHNQVEKKKIKLVSCLQDKTNKDNEYYFYKSKYYPSSYTKIERITQINPPAGVFDVIACYTEDSKFPNLFLGHWNDGAV